MDDEDIFNELFNGIKSDNMKAREHRDKPRWIKKEVDRGCRRDHPFGVGGGITSICSSPANPLITSYAWVCSVVLDIESQGC